MGLRDASACKKKPCKINDELGEGESGKSHDKEEHCRDQSLIQGVEISKKKTLFGSMN